jgi:hypothetical protein
LELEKLELELKLELVKFRIGRFGIGINRIENGIGIGKIGIDKFGKIEIGIGIGIGRLEIA